MSTTPSSPPPDTRTYNQKLLDQIRALMLGKALDDVAMYKIGERELTKMTLPDLRRWEAEVEKRVRNEIRRSKGLGMRFVPILFGSAEAPPSSLLVDVAGLVFVVFFIVALVCLVAFL